MFLLTLALVPAVFSGDPRFPRSRSRFLWHSCRAVAELFWKLGKDQFVGFAKQFFEFGNAQGITRFQCYPFGAREVGRGNNARPFGELSKILVRSFKGKADWRRDKRGDGEHLTSYLEQKIIAPLNLLGSSGEGEAEFAKLFDVHGTTSNCLVRGVAAEEGIRFPLRTRRSICGGNQRAAREFLVGGRGLQIHWLIHVVRGGMIAVGKPVFEDCLFGRA